MTSNDNQQSITIDVSKSEISDLRNEMRSGFAQNNSEFKSYAQKFNTSEMSLSSIPLKLMPTETLPLFGSLLSLSLLLS